MTALLTGYADRISVRAGETIAFRISSHASGPFAASLVRVICGDPNPAGTGPIFEDQSSVFAGRYPSIVQHARCIVDTRNATAGHTSENCRIWKA